MTGVIVALSITDALLLATIIVGSIKMRTLSKQVTSVATCLVEYIRNKDSIEVIEEYSINDFTFPSKDGF